MKRLSTSIPNDCNVFYESLFHHGGAEGTEKSSFFAHRETAMGKNNMRFQKINISVVSMTLW